MNQPIETNGKARRRSELERAATELDDAAECLKNAAGLIRGALGEAPPRPAPAATVLPGDRVSTRQLAAIHAIARKAGLDRQRLGQMIQETHGSDDPASLGRSEASELIDWLQALVR